MKRCARNLVWVVLATVWLAGLPCGAADATSDTSMQGSTIEGTLEKYDSTLNKLTLRGADDELVVMDADRALKARNGDVRVQMGIVKHGQKIQVIYVEKSGKKIVRDVVLIRGETEGDSLNMKKPPATGAQSKHIEIN